MNNGMKFAVVAGLLGLGLLVPSWMGGFHLSLLTQVLIFALMALSVDLLTGYVGLVPLGHAGIFGTAAYVVAYGLTRGGLSSAASVALALAGGVLISALFGVLAVRTGGIYFIMLTLAEGMIVWGIALRWTSVTGGANGIPGINRPAVLRSDIAFYYVVLVLFVGGFWLLSLIVSSPFGLTLKGIRERESRMRTLGYSPFLHKFLAFLISGIYATVAGILFSFYNGYISPGSLNFLTSAESLLMVIVGGAGTLWGALIGSGVVLYVRNIVSLFTDRWNIVMGLIFIVTILFARDGIMGLARRVFPSRAE